MEVPNVLFGTLQELIQLIRYFLPRARMHWGLLLELGKSMREHNINVGNYVMEHVWTLLVGSGKRVASVYELLRIYINHVLKVGNR